LDYNGFRLYADEPGDETGAALEYYGEYRQSELEVLTALLAPAMVMLQVDAGVGVDTLPLARWLGPEGHVFVYENDRMRRQVLAQNLKANRLANVTLMRRRLRTRHGDGEGKPHHSVDRFNVAGNNAERDDSIDELRLERLDWVKIDEGGNASDVLKGANDTLWRLRPRLHVHAASEDELARLASQASEFGYACWRSEMPLFNPRNFNHRDVDLFEGRMALALIALPEEIGLEIQLPGCRRVG
jgi:FkbM family methyltransferase